MLKIVRSANETRFTDLLMTKELGKANGREVFVSHKGMDVYCYEIKGLQVDGCWSLLYEVHPSL